MRINTHEFTYRDGTFVAEMSNFKGHETILFNRITSEAILFSKVFDDGKPLPDGCSLLDEGFELVSERSGKVVKMVFYKRHFDGESELTHWEWRPFECNAFHNLIIFND